MLCRSGKIVLIGGLGRSIPQLADKVFQIAFDEEIGLIVAIDGHQFVDVIKGTTFQSEVESVLTAVLQCAACNDITGNCRR